MGEKRGQNLSEKKQAVAWKNIFSSLKKEPSESKTKTDISNLNVFNAKDQSELIKFSFKKNLSQIFGSMSISKISNFKESVGNN